jgi:hypothetical protein
MWKVGSENKPESDLSESTLVDHVSYGDVINGVLDEAIQKARVTERDELFTVKVDPKEVPWEALYVRVMEPVMERSMGLGFRLISCLDWTFKFIKL